MVLLSGGHPKRVTVQAIAFAVGGLATAAGTYGAIGAIGGAIPIASPSLAQTALALGSIWTLAWYAHPAPRLLPSPTKQLNRRYVEVPVAGAALFGSVLGVGLLTPVTTPFVWTGAIAALASGSGSAGALYGAGFAGGRTFQLLQQRIHRPGVANRIPSRIVVRARPYRLVGALWALALLTFGLAPHLHG